MASSASIQSAARSGQSVSCSIGSLLCEPQETPSCPQHRTASWVLVTQQRSPTPSLAPGGRLRAAARVVSHHPCDPYHRRFCITSEGR